MKSIFLLVLILISSTQSYGQGFSANDREKAIKALSSLAQRESNDWRFVIITDENSKKFIQFYGTSDDLFYDFPVHYFSSKNQNNVIQEQNCSSVRPESIQAEEMHRTISASEEWRFKNILDKMRFDGLPVFCMRFAKNDKRSGYSLAYRGRLSNPAQAISFAEAIFAKVFLVKDLQRVSIETNR